MSRTSPLPVAVYKSFGDAWKAAKEIVDGMPRSVIELYGYKPQMHHADAASAYNPQYDLRVSTEHTVYEVEMH